MPYIIGVCGASCSGKTTACEMLVNKIKQSHKNIPITILSQDRYYRGGDDKTNYDSPEAIDFDLLTRDLQKLKDGETILAPTYNYKTHSRKDNHEILKSAPIIIVEGILIFHQQNLVDLFDLKVYIDAIRELRFERRLKRDCKERGRDAVFIRDQYFKFVLPSNNSYVEPCKWKADIVLMNNIHDNFIGIDILFDHIESKLLKLGFYKS